MSRILIIGYGPLPRAGMSCVTAASLRTRQLLKPILEAGHTVNLFTLPVPGAEEPESKMLAMRPDNYEGLAHQRFTVRDGAFAIRMLREQAHRLQPDAILGAGAFPAYIAAMLGIPTPLWADLPGSWMAENQGLCWIDQNDARLAEAWAIERTIVRRLDKFSAVSRAQLYAVLGELAAVGRMNQYTFEYSFGHHLPNACHRWTPGEGANEEPAGATPAEGETPPKLRGPIVPPEAFIILWSGSFKLSCDVPTLVSVVNKLMERHRVVHLVVTGGPAEGVVSQPHQLFEELVEQSPFKDRCHLLGWLPSDRLPAIYREVDLAIHLDARNYETLFGGRNRLGTLAAEGVPIATTAGTEIGEWLADGRAVLTAPMGDADAMVAAIEPWIERREGLKAYARRAAAMAEREFTPAATARKLLLWLKNPKPAPDNRVKLEQAKGRPIDPASVALNAIEEQALLLARHDAKDLAAAAARLDAARSRKGFFFSFRRP
jgi:glycosyltransferase involved in cell wall biosynthesis